MCLFFIAPKEYPKSHPSRQPVAIREKTIKLVVQACFRLYRTSCGQLTDSSTRATASLKVDPVPQLLRHALLEPIIDQQSLPIPDRAMLHSVSRSQETRFFEYQYPKLSGGFHRIETLETRAEWLSRHTPGTIIFNCPRGITFHSKSTDVDIRKRGVAVLHAPHSSNPTTQTTDLAGLAGQRN